MIESINFEFKDKSVTLLDILENRSKNRSLKNALTFLQDLPCSYSELWTSINNVASYLITKGIKKGEKIILLLENSKDFFFAFYGIQRAGGIAVPLFPGSGFDRVDRLANLCETRTIIVSNKYLFKNKELLGKKGNKLNILAIEKIVNTNFKQIYPEVNGDDIAFIQFTSGSVGDPKGVLISHQNLITNIQQMIDGMKITKKDIFVSWLPVYHDMGLILMTMVPFFLGLNLHLLPTGLNYIKTWLKTIEVTKATFTAAPDFVYRFCLAYIDDPANYDISSLRIALNAAEPVRSTTIINFEKSFGIKNVLLPAYGLAEATVGVSCATPGKTIITDKRNFVSVGHPFSGVNISIWDKRIQVDCLKIGEIRVNSSANTRGYYRNPNSTKKLIDEHGNIKTGDLGYIDESGNLYVVGREKNIIIQGGINISAREVEELTDQFSFVRRSAVVGIDKGKNYGELVYLFLEIRLKKSQLDIKNIFEEISIKIVNKFFDSFGFRPGRVYLLKPGSIPMTYNGKIKYLELKKMYLEAYLKKESLILYPDY